MSECEDCGYGFIPLVEGSLSICTDCLEMRWLWEEWEEERQASERKDNANMSA